MGRMRKKGQGKKGESWNEGGLWYDIERWSYDSDVRPRSCDAG